MIKLAEALCEDVEAMLLMAAIVPISLEKAIYTDSLAFYFVRVLPKLNVVERTKFKN